MKSPFFTKYNKVKYLLRIKHWRGRSVHSPFLYDVVRSAFMRNDTIEIESALYQDLIKNNLKEKEAKRVCRLYAHLKYSSYKFGSANYAGEDMVIINDQELNSNQLLHISEEASRQRNTVCVIIPNIYSSRKRYKSWQLISALTGGVAVDLYHGGYLFFDYYLNKQRFKMRF